MAGRRRIGVATATIALFAFAATAIASRPCAAQEQVVTLHSAGLDGCLPSPKDAGLKRALGMLGDRIMELPAETGDHSMPAPVIRMALDLLMRPMSFRTSMLPGIENMDLEHMEAPPIALQLDFYTGTPDEAQALSAQLGELIQMAAPMPAADDPDHPGMKLIDADGAPLRFGAGRVGGQNALSIALNQYSTDIPRIDLAGLPEGVQPALAMEVNTVPLMPLIEKAIETASVEQRAMIEAQLAMYGLAGDAKLRIVGASGYSADRAHSFLRLVNGRVMAEQQHALAESTITLDDLKRIPADASYGEVGKFNPAYFTAMIDLVRAQMPPHMQGEDPIEMFAQMTGVNLQTDLLDHLGDTYWSYMADSTGGGLFGSVTIMRLTNPAGMRDTLSNLTQMVNQMAQGEAKGYVRLMTREVEAHDMTVLTFPGLPIPLEISFAVVGDDLYMAMSPQSLIAAVGQSTNAASSILDNPRFVEMGGASAAGAMQVAFMDTPRLIPSGYGLVSMGMAALGNAVRSPRDTERDPGLLMPSMSDVMNGAKAMMWVTRVEGDDIIMRAQGDRSSIVNACGAAGTLGGATGVAVIGAVAAGFVMPAVSQAQMQAQSTMSMHQLRQLAMAVQFYAAENDDLMPESIEQLIEAGYLSREAIDSPLGDAFDGFDFGLRTTGRVSEIQFPDRQILAWDRITVQQGNRVNVAFADGHVESLLWSELEHLLAHPSNEGVDLMGG